MEKPLITIASGNLKKVAEIESMLGPLPITVKAQPKDINIEETGSSYLENAILKAQAASKMLGTWTIADDSGLEVDKLNGAPGIFSARYAETNEAKITKLLYELGESPYRSARFVSVMVLCNPNGETITHSEGICWGEILKDAAYSGGEFESIFWVREANSSYGELSDEQLTRLGSRGKAARALSGTLLKQFNL